MEYNSKSDGASDIRSILTGQEKDVSLLGTQSAVCFVAYGEVKYKTLKRQREETG